MPTYEFACDLCGNVTDAFYSIADKPEKIACPHCPGIARFIISKPMVQVDSAQDIPWLDDFRKKRKEARFGGRQIETRQEYKQYLKENDLRPADAENLSEV